MMKKIYQTLAIAAFLTCMPAMSAKADDEGLAGNEEIWEMTYDDYQSKMFENPEYRGHTRMVTMRWNRDSKEFSIKGLFEECPESWTDGYFTSKNLFIRSNQTLTDKEGRELCLNLGDVTGYSTSKDDRQFTIGVSIKILNNVSLKFGDEGENKDLLAANQSGYALWIAAERENMNFSRTYYFDGAPTGDIFESMPMIVNPTLRKIGVSGIGNIRDDQDRHADDAVYDLSGRQVNPENLTPGIYIRGGRKFIVR